MEQVNKEQAMAIYESEIWKKWNDEEIVTFQLFQNLLCMDFSRFHKAVEKVLDRPVFTSEFGDADSLRKEYLGEKEAPTFQEVIDIIPEEKRDSYFQIERRKICIKKI